MRWASALSKRSTLEEALGEALAAVRADLRGARADLVFVFSSVHHGLGWGGLPAAVRTAFPGARLVGCSGGGVLGDGVEREGEVALSLVAASLPDVVIQPFHLSPAWVGPGARPDPDELEALIGVEPGAAPAFVLLSEPYSCDVGGLVAALDQLWPHGAKVGAVASGGGSPGQNALFLDDEVHREGAVGVALMGAVELDTVVSQGCRPVGEPLRVTAVNGPVVLELDGLPALGRFQKVFQGLDEPSRKLFQVQPMVGVAIDPDGVPGRGDFLVRHIAGVDPKRHGIAFAHPVRLGDVVQFHVRDASASVEDLHELLARYARVHGAPEGVLLFSCLGRGARFYRRADVDSRTVRELLGDVALGGIFGHGEIGPIHGRTFLHGYTAALGLFRAPSWN